MSNQDVSVVVCTKNNKKNIETVVKSIIREKPGEVIVVDGKSTDGTRDIIDKLTVKVITDPGKGLALARQLALETVRTKYIFYVGDDNVLKKGCLARLKEYMAIHDWIGVACQTRIKNSYKDYWAFCANARWKLRFTEGERSVVGTPYMFETWILKKAQYDKNCSVSDDSDIGEKISRMTEKKYGYADEICYEIGKTGYKETKKRFLMYGKSDAQFWKKYSLNWSWRRKLQSILHPIKDEFIRPLSEIKSLKCKVYTLPYFLMITFIRYMGWLKESGK